MLQLGCIHFTTRRCREGEQQHRLWMKPASSINFSFDFYVSISLDYNHKETNSRTRLLFRWVFIINKFICVRSHLIRDARLYVEILLFRFCWARTFQGFQICSDDSWLLIDQPVTSDFNFITIRMWLLWAEREICLCCVIIWSFESPA